MRLVLSVRYDYSVTICQTVALSVRYDYSVTICQTVLSVRYDY